jgi:A/G-specific adenine glycosylase
MDSPIYCIDLPGEQASASIDEVNAVWKGLGYYGRASRLLAGAQLVVNDYGGKLPDNAKDLESKIPGIGRYTSGAIASIAYGERVPVVRESNLSFFMCSVRTNEWDSR